MGPMNEADREYLANNDSVSPHREDEIYTVQVVLGSMLIDPACVGLVMAEASESDFTGKNKDIFLAIRELYFAQSTIDPVTVLNKVGEMVTKNYKLREYQDYVLALMQVTPTAANVGVYLKLLKEQTLVDRANGIGYELAYAFGVDKVLQHFDELEKLLSNRQTNRIVSFKEGMQSFYARHDGTKSPDYLRWGFGALNNMLCAESGDFIILGGYPSSGKTVLALEFAWEMSSYCEKRVGVFSFETKDEKIYDRLICRVAGVPFEQIKHNTLSNDSWTAVAGATHFCDTVNLDVIRAGGMTVNDIRAISLSRHYDVIFIDYLQLIQTGGHSKGNRAEEVAGISMALHTFAQTADVTVVALSQLTRSDKGEKYKAPKMNSLRESGQLEQDADMIMLLYLIDEDVPSGPRRLKVGKNKEGEQGLYIDLELHAKLMKFVQISSRTDEPQQRKSRFTEEPAGDEQAVMDVFNKQEGSA